MRYDLKEVREAREGRSEGTYHVEVLDVQDKYTLSQQKRMSLVLSEVGTDGQVVCYDGLMMEGKGLGITKKKLQALGIDLNADSFDSAELVGRRLYVACVFGKPNTNTGKSYLEVNIRAPGSMCGYYPESAPPAPAVDDSNPDTWPKGDGEVVDTPF